MPRSLFQKIAERIWCYKGRQVVFDELERLRAEVANVKYELHDEIRGNMSPLKFPIVKSKEETLDAILCRGCSIARLGDGEFLLALGRSIPFQDYSPELARRLRQVLASDNPRLLVGIPNLFGSLESVKPEYRLVWRMHFAACRSKIYELLSFDKTYYDTQLSRPYIIYDQPGDLRGYFDRFKMIWKDKEVVLIEGSQSRLGLGNDLLATAASVRRILAPPKNAFRRHDELLREAARQSPKVLFLLALGPTATVLACDLAERGWQALDIGHIDIEYEWFLRKAQQKLPIPGKYVNEARGGDRVDNRLVDSEYRRQVIAEVL